MAKKKNTARWRRGDGGESCLHPFGRGPVRARGSHPQADCLVAAPEWTLRDTPTRILIPLLHIASWNFDR